MFLLTNFMQYLFMKPLKNIKRCIYKSIPLGEFKIYNLQVFYSVQMHKYMT